MSSDPHERVQIAKLLFVGGLVETIAKGQSAIAHGNVYVEQWNIGIAESRLPRWVLCGTTITVSGRSMRISEDGSKILRSTLQTHL